MTSIYEHVEQLSNKHTQSLGDLQADSDYYESANRVTAIGISTPPEMRVLLAQIGWPRMYLDSLEERLDVEGFRLAGNSEADTRLWDWWQANDLDEESGLGHIETMVHGRSYITVAASDDPDMDPDTPVIRVESPKNMYAEVDPRTRKVKRGIRIYRLPNSIVDDAATLFLPDRTVLLERESGYSPWRVVQVVEHNLGVVPVIPMVNRARLSDRMGRSEITPELRSVTDAAARTMMNMQAAAELMAVPQRLLFGVAQEALSNNPDSPSATLDAYFARILAFEDPDGSATQFSAAELRNFTEVLQELSKQAASYTGLPPQYLSFSSENPASAEAIRSSESRIVKKCERKARMLGGSWESAMRIGMLIVDGVLPDGARRMETLWRDPSTPTFASKADGVRKLYGNGPIIPLERARVDMGYSEQERLEMNKWDDASPTSQVNALLGGIPRNTAPAPTPDDLPVAA